MTTPTEDNTPYRFEPTSSVADLLEGYGHLEDGEETGVEVTVAGRLMLRRDQGKLAFGVLADQTGRIQLFATQAATPDFDSFTGLHIGDWLGVTGEVIRTRGASSRSVSVRGCAWPRPASRSPTSGTASLIPIHGFVSATWTCG